MNKSNDHKPKKNPSEEAEELRSLCSAQSTKAPRDSGKRLATMPRGDGEELRLVWAAYDGHPYLNISLWRKDAYGVFRPLGEKTMSVRIPELPDFLDGVQKAIEAAKEELSRRNGE